MRLIDADVLLAFVKKKYHDIVAGGYPYNIVAYDLVRIIEKEPTIDAVPVVRCENCEHWDRSWKPTKCIAAHFCPMTGLVTGHDFYCGHGAKMDGEADGR